jgi:hypothetical protein
MIDWLRKAGLPEECWRSAVASSIDRHIRQALRCDDDPFPARSLLSAELPLFDERSNDGQRELLLRAYSARSRAETNESNASTSGRFVRRQAANRLGDHRGSIREVSATRGENAEAVMLDLV